MPKTRLLRSAAAGLLAASCAGPAGALDGFLYTREVQVPASGWVRVPLDLPAIQHLAAGGADLHVFAPGGGEVPVRVAPAARSSERRDVQVVKVDKVEDGWTLLFDAGPDAAPHERLFLATAPMTSDRAVRLDGSADGKAWHALAAGELLRLGAQEEQREVSLSYPQTEDRFLRLAWPEEAGLPRVEAAQVETVSGPSLTFATHGAECKPGGQASIACALDLPAAGQTLRRMTLEIEGPGAVGYRLYAPEDGAWKLLREGTWQRTAGRSQHFLPGGEDALAGSRLRLELFGAGEPGGAAPRLTGWGVELAAQSVLFRADEPGPYTLAYGGAARHNHRAEEPPAGAETAWLAAGPEKEGKEGGAAPFPEALGAPGAPLGNARFEASWAVLAPSAKPGDLVRLELPDAVYANARPDLGDVRLSLGVNQIPFYRWTPPEPAPAGGNAGMRPAPTRKAGESEVEILLAAAGLPLTRMILATPGGPLRRTVEVRYLEPLRSRLPDDPRERMPAARALWECAPEPPLPCRAEIKLSGPAPKILSLRLDDGDNPPLAALDTALWRRRDVLLFVWPKPEKGGRVRLQAGSERLTAPAYDFATLGDILPARPWQAAELDLSGASPAAGASRWARWAMPIVLTIAGLLLLFLLGRILSEH